MAVYVEFDAMKAVKRVILLWLVLAAFFALVFVVLQFRSQWMPEWWVYYAEVLGVHLLYFLGGVLIAKVGCAIENKWRNRSDVDLLRFLRLKLLRSRIYAAVSFGVMVAAYIIGYSMESPPVWVIVFLATVGFLAMMQLMNRQNSNQAEKLKAEIKQVHERLSSNATTTH